MRAWLFKDSRQERKLGDKCPWSVGWIDPDGKRKSKRIGSKSMADKFRRKIEGELAAKTYQNDSRKSWDEFYAEYKEKITCGMKPQTKRCTLDSVRNFERLIKPKRLSSIKTQTIDDYINRRKLEDGKKKGDKVSPATVNKELRHLRAVLRVANDWGYLSKVPKFRMVKEPKKLVRYVIPEHFTAIYEGCKAAQFPKNLSIPASDWWQALLVFSYMTGWRISEPLALRREDLDLDACEAITRHEDNKGGRDEVVPLHPVVVEHLQRIVSFEPVVFPWYHHPRTLHSEFHRIQRKAGIHLVCHSRHEHTDACHYYGFHDLRRAFATANAETLSADALQALMRHKSYSTTQRYINMAKQLKQSAEKIHVPDVLREAN